MTTHVDGTSPSVAPDPDDAERDDGSDLGAEWVRAEMARRMAANRSTRGRHARRSEDARPEQRDPGPEARRRVDTPPRPWAAAPAAPPADPPENYVPRHSVQTPGPAADPAAPAGGPAPVARPAAGGALGGPSLPSGLPVRRKRSGPGTPLQSEGGAAVGPWSGPGPAPVSAPAPASTPAPAAAPASAAASAPASAPASVVPEPHEPARRLGAPPEMLGGPQAAPSWGLPLATPIRGMPVTGSAVAVEPPAPAVTEPVVAAPVTTADATDEAPSPRVAPDAEDGRVAADDDTLPGTDRAPAYDDEAPADEAPADEAPADDEAPAAEAPAADGSPAAPVAAQETGTDGPAPTADVADGADPPTDQHPIVLPRRTVVPGRTLAVPAQRGVEAARTPPPPRTPRAVPVVGTAPAEPGSTRVRVVLSERKGVARPVRTIKEVQEGTAVGELLRRDLIRSQLRVTLRFAVLTVLVLGSLPVLFALLPEVSRIQVLGLRLPWILLGFLVYPFLVGVAWRYTRLADRVEQSFADHVQD